MRELRIYVMDVILRSTEVYQSSATSSSQMKHWTTYLHCLWYKSYSLPYRNENKPEPSVLHERNTLTSVSEITHHDASCVHNHILILRCSFPRGLLSSVSKEFCAAAKLCLEYTAYVRITSPLVLCSMRWPGQTFFYPLLIKSPEVLFETDFWTNPIYWNCRI